MILKDIFISALFNRCPRCHKGKVFEDNNAYRLKNSFRMKPDCSECGLHYEREPGFFYGAMYVSYGLMVGLFIAWFFADLFWLHMKPLNLAMAVAATVILFFPLVYRWARIVWLNFFFRYEKPSEKKQHLAKPPGNQQTFPQEQLQNH
jgi:uncharacterized protein (DUF983 family)